MSFTIVLYSSRVRIAVIGFVDDALEPASAPFYPGKFGLAPHKNDKEKAKHLKKITEEVLPPKLARIEALLATNTKVKAPPPSKGGLSGWLSPSKAASNGSASEEMLFSCGTHYPTVADFFLCVRLKGSESRFENVLEPFPLIKALIDKFYALDAIKAYYS